MRNGEFSTEELRAMATIGVAICGHPGNVQEQVLKTASLVDQAELPHFVLLREIDRALAPFPRARRAAILAHLISGKPLLESPHAASAATQTVM